SAIPDADLSDALLDDASVSDAPLDDASVVDGPVVVDAAVPDAPVQVDSSPPPTGIASLKFETPGPISLAIGPAGLPVITGGLFNSSRFGDVTLAAQADPGKEVTLADVFLVAFDAAAKSRWGKRFGDSADQFGSAIAVNADGTILIAGP